MLSMVEAGVRPHRVLALEGIDGAGKTSVGKLVAQTTGNTYFYCTQDNPLARYRKRFDSSPTPMRFMFYLGLTMANHNRIEQLRMVSDVMYDRTVLSTIAYHQAYGLNPNWFKLIPPSLYDQLDLMVLFTVGEEERLARLGQRGSISVSDYKSLTLRKALDESFMQLFTAKRVIVDTTGKTPDQSAQEVIRAVYG